MDRVLGEVSRAVGSRIRSAAVAPWGSKNQTTIVVLDDGRELVVQRYRDITTARRRVRAVEQLAPGLREHGAQTPLLVASDLDAPIAWAAYERMQGEVCYVAAGDDLSAPTFPVMARSMGKVVRALHQLPVSDYVLDDSWVDPVRLARLGETWLGPLTPHMPDATADATRAVIREAPDLLADRPTAVAHGDFGPQNVLINDSHVSALLDFEDARFADPLLDVAWWAWLVRAHTPAAFNSSWHGFTEAAAVDPNGADFDARCVALIVLRVLETAETFRHSQPEKYPSWARRLSTTLHWWGHPLFPAGTE